MSRRPVTLEMALASIGELLRRRGMDASGVHPGTQIEELGLDSTDVVDLFTDLEVRSGCQLDPDSAMDIVSVRDLVALSAQ